MKKLLCIIALSLFAISTGFSQPISSGKSTILINNKPASETKAAPGTVENVMPAAMAATAATLPVGAGKYYALIIGINDYADPNINSLDFCIRDAEAFYNAVTSFYTFDKENVKLLKNATMSDIVTSLDYFAKVVKPNDSFLIFYAGHGVWNKASETGFWLPSDARKNSTLNWFRNSALRDYLREVNSKHTLLITDACFAGSIFKTRAAFSDAELAVNKLYELPSRKAMTSGTLTEVPDQSAFLKYMIDRLNANKEKYLSSEQLFSSFRIAVINNSNVIPQYGEIKDVGDEGGDFIFIHK
ncbi:MAG TPA: caspase family protein [Bacteroidales bacterium]|nr:caspase family protein [Bacteroidales bacterium]